MYLGQNYSKQYITNVYGNNTLRSRGKQEYLCGGDDVAHHDVVQIEVSQLAKSEGLNITSDSIRRPTQRQFHIILFNSLCVRESLENG